MNLKFRIILTVVLVALLAAFAAGCSSENTPYQINDAENYTVSVKFDANGGIFTTNTYVITDSYDISQLPVNAEGKVEIPLITPDNQVRGKDAFTPVNNGYFLAGWYTECVQSGGTENPSYRYSGKWDFEKDRLTLDPNGDYSSAQPQLTLYAAWVPLFEIQFYDLSSGQLLDTKSFDPNQGSEILIPQWDAQSGAVDMHNFPKRNGYTFNGAFYDAEGKQPVETSSIVHPGKVNEQNGTAENESMAVYVDWLEGEWFHIYTADQFIKNASVSGNYVIHADLDFTDKNWPSNLMTGNFSGTIQGNGYSFKNISMNQTQNNKVNTGLFGQLTEKASISDLSLENVTLTIKSGTRMMGACFGLFAGAVSEQATINGVQILSGALQIDSGCYFGTEDYSIGLICGSGTTDLDYSKISCTAVGENPDQVKITVSQDQVSLEFTA